MVKLTSFVAAALVMGAIAHPGAHKEDTLDPMAKRAFLAQSRRRLEACAKHLEVRGTTKRAEAYRHALVSKYLKRNANKGMKSRHFKI